MTKRPRAVIFDWDNTLVDSWGPIHDALNTTLLALGHAPWTLDDTKARARLSLRDSFPTLFGDRWTDARRIYLEAFQKIHLERLTPLPGAGAFVERLATLPIYLAVVSNKTGRLLREEVTALGWDLHFGKVIGAGDAEADKPHKAPVEAALASSGIEPGPAVWYIGDNEIDIATARAADCTAVLIHGAVDGPQPDLSFPSFAEAIATFSTHDT